MFEKVVYNRIVNYFNGGIFLPREYKLKHFSALYTRERNACGTNRPTPQLFLPTHGPVEWGQRAPEGPESVFEYPDLSMQASLAMP